MEFRIQRYQGEEDAEKVEGEQHIDVFQQQIEERRRKRKLKTESSLI